MHNIVHPGGMSSEISQCQAAMSTQVSSTTVHRHFSATCITSSEQPCTTCSISGMYHECRSVSTGCCGFMLHLALSACSFDRILCCCRECFWFCAPSEDVWGWGFQPMPPLPLVN